MVISTLAALLLSLAGLSAGGVAANKAINEAGKSNAKRNSDDAALIYANSRGRDAFASPSVTGRVEDLMPYVDDALQDSAFWNSLSKAEKESYVQTLQPSWFTRGSTVKSNIQQLLDDVRAMDDYFADVDADLQPLDVEAINNEYLENVYDPLYAELTDLANQQEQNYNQQMALNRQSYDLARNGILDDQYRSNAAIQDALQSDISRTRQSALEAGASAGVRIAGNINATLSAQNKQSATAMETSNNLAQMLLNQRQAQAGLTSDYHNYRTQNLNQRASMESSKQANMQSNLNMKQNEYDNRVGNAVDSMKRDLTSNQFSGNIDAYARNKYTNYAGYTSSAVNK